MAVPALKMLGVNEVQGSGSEDVCSVLVLVTLPTGNYMFDATLMPPLWPLAAGRCDTGMRSVQAEPGKSAGRYNCGLTLTLYPQQQVVLTPQDIAELGRKDMVLLWKVPPQPPHTPHRGS